MKKKKIQTIQQQKNQTFNIRIRLFTLRITLRLIMIQTTHILVTYFLHYRADNNSSPTQEQNTRNEQLF